MSLLHDSRDRSSRVIRSRGRKLNRNIMWIHACGRKHFAGWVSKKVGMPNLSFKSSNKQVTILRPFKNMEVERGSANR